MKNKRFSILAVDDSQDDRTLIDRALRQSGVTCPIHWVTGGHEAIAYLRGEGRFADRNEYPYPSFVMTDLKMPEGDGFSVLEHLKNNPEWAIIPTVVFSTSTDLDDIKRSYMLGAGSYIEKPTDYHEMKRRLGIFYAYWMECETPEVDSTGRRVHTASAGKLGARFINQYDNETG